MIYIYKMESVDEWKRKCLNKNVNRIKYNLKMSSNNLEGGGNVFRKKIQDTRELNEFEEEREGWKADIKEIDGELNSALERINMRDSDRKFLKEEKKRIKDLIRNSLKMEELAEAKKTYDDSPAVIQDEIEKYLDFDLYDKSP